jgi:very-short-patch-repair endonuclease
MIEKYNKNLEDLIDTLNSKKVRIVEFLKKHFKENVDFISKKTSFNRKVFPDGKKLGGSGGRNKIDYFMTEKVYDLILNSYKPRHRKTIKLLNGSEVKYINRVLNLEQSTIGFIYDCFKKTFSVKKQYRVLTYFIDLYFIDENIAIECDENNHKDRDEKYETDRELSIINKLGCKFIRFNPNDPKFNLSNIISKIIEIIKK